jgi:nucleoside phosphorylase
MEVIDKSAIWKDLNKLAHLKAETVISGAKIGTSPNALEKWIRDWFSSDPFRCIIRLGENEIGEQFLALSKPTFFHAKDRINAVWNGSISQHYSASPEEAEETLYPSMYCTMDKAVILTLYSLSDGRTSLEAKIKHPACRDWINQLVAAIDLTFGLTDNVQSSRILIVTAAKVEALAVLDVFSAARDFTQRTIGKTIYYDLGVHGGAPVFMVQSEIGIATPGGALLTVSQAIEDLHPQAIIMCGIAFGLRKDEQKLGDILISHQISCYEPQKIDCQQGQISRGDRATASRRLLKLFRSGELNWQGAKLHFGRIVSGEKLVNTPEFHERLLETEPKP